MDDYLIGKALLEGLTKVSSMFIHDSLLIPELARIKLASREISQAPHTMIISNAKILCYFV